MGGSACAKAAARQASKQRQKAGSSSDAGRILARNDRVDGVARRGVAEGRDAQGAPFGSPQDERERRGGAAAFMSELKLQPPKKLRRRFACGPFFVRVYKQRPCGGDGKAASSSGCARRGRASRSPRGGPPHSIKTDAHGGLCTTRLCESRGQANQLLQSFRALRDGRGKPRPYERANRRWAGQGRGTSRRERGSRGGRTWRRRGRRGSVFVR
jgi:hypothetical protein